MTIILLQAQHLIKRFGGKNLFTNVNLRINQKSHIALVGRNGAGKSTLAKMLIGQESIDGGKVIKKNHLRIGYLAQNTGLHSNHSIREEMRSVFKNLIRMAHHIHKLEQIMGKSSVINDPVRLKNVTKQYDHLQNRFNQENGYRYQKQIRSVLHAFGFGPKDYDKNINNLSGGQQSQLALAKLLLEKKDLLILDEPTNHIDVKTITWLENYLKSYPGALFIISHDRYFLDQVASEVYNLKFGTLSHYYGNYTQFVAERRKRYFKHLKAYQRQQSHIKHEEIFIKKNIARASTSNRAKSRRKQLSKIKRISSPIRSNKVAHFRFHPARQSGEVVLTVHDLAIGYRHQKISYPINLNIKRNQVTAIIGPNGIGKSTLLKTLIGKVPKISGSIQYGTHVRIGYYDQKQASLHENKTVLHEIWDAHPDIDEGKIRSILGSFLFSGKDVDKTVHDLSGGERARLQLTKLSMTHSNFLLLDEPTNHLDIDSREVLENALRHFAGTILFVSHDRYFINQLADYVVEISHKGSKTYLGNYDYYVDKKEEERAVKQRKLEKFKNTHPNVKLHHKKIHTSSQREYLNNKAKQKAKRKLKRKVQSLENEISQFDQKKHQIELEMTKPANLKNPSQLNSLQKQIKKIDQNEAPLEKKWETLGIRLENFD